MHNLSVDGLVQVIRNFIANALELRLSCTNPSICSLQNGGFLCRGSVLQLVDNILHYTLSLHTHPQPEGVYANHGHYTNHGMKLAIARYLQSNSCRTALT